MSDDQYLTIRIVCALQYLEAAFALFWQRALPSSELYRLYQRQVRMVSTETPLYLFMYKRTFLALPSALPIWRHGADTDRDEDFGERKIWYTYLRLDIPMR